MSAELFISRLEQKGLLDQHVVKDLRRRIARSQDKRITPEAIAKFLVDKGHLTAFQATKLVNEVTAIKKKQAQQRKKDAGKPNQLEAELQFAPDADDAVQLGDKLNLDETAAPPPTAPLEKDTVAKSSTKGPAKFKKKEKKGKPKAPRGDDIDEDDLIRVEATDAGDDNDNLTRAPESPAEPVAPTPEKSSAPAPPPPPPPVEDLQSDPLDDAEDLGALESAAVSRSGSQRATSLDALTRGKSGTSQKLQATNEWDSKLLLIGGGSLGVLVVLGAFLVLSLTRGSAEEILSGANEDYNSGAYASAMKRYDQFLKYYSGNDNASHARVYRALARLRQVYTNPEQGLRVAKEILPKIESEDALDEGQPELASMLPQIADGFVTKAKLSDDTAEQEKLLAATHEAMQLVGNTTYIPTALGRAIQTTVQRINDDMARVQREIDRERNLQSTILAINQAVGEDKTNDAYAARQALLDTYPGLDTNERLYEAVLKITEKQRERVTTSSEVLTATQQDHAAPADRKVVVLAHQRGQGDSGAQGYVTFVLAGGSVFALDMATGHVLWRRYVGFETTSYPQPISPTRAGADALVVDQRTNEVLRIEAKTGKLLWRLALGEPFADPVVTDQRIYIAARSGKLYLVDPATGNATHRAVIDQSLEVAPGMDGTRQFIYQPGEHDNLYVLANDSLECREVVYLGHKPGTIAVPPVMALGFLLVVENGPDYATIHVLKSDAQGLHLKKAQTPIQLRGRVLVPPIVGRRRVLFVTDRRAIALYDIDPNNESGKPLMVTAQRSATAESPMISHALMDRGYLWIANNRFSKFQVQAATGKLPPEWIKDEQDIYVAPLRMIHDIVIHVRRHAGSDGVVVGATPLQAENPIWQTELAIPLLQTTVDAQGIHSVSGRGRLFNLNRDAFTQPALNKAQLSAVKDEVQMLTLGASVPLPQGQFAFTQNRGYTQIVFYRPATPAPSLRLLTLTVPRGDAAHPPMPLDKGLLVCQKTGKISLVDAVAGGDQAHPFQPELPPGTVVEWTTPATIPGTTEFVVADNQRHLYRVGLKPTPQPNLAELKTVDLTLDLVGQLAATDKLAAGIGRGNTGDTLQLFQLTDLTKGPECPLPGRVRWGPLSVGDSFLVATDQMLLSVAPNGKARWQAKLEGGAPVGRPIVTGTTALFAFTNGLVAQLNLDSGKILATRDVAEPLAAGPIVMGNELVLTGKSGTLMIVPTPTP